MENSVDMNNIGLKCHICNNDIEQGRIELGLDSCRECAFKINVPKFSKQKTSIVSLEKAYKMMDRSFGMTIRTYGVSDES